MKKFESLGRSLSKGEQKCTYRTMLTPSFRFYLDPPIPDQVDPLVT